MSGTIKREASKTETLIADHPLRWPLGEPSEIDVTVPGEDDPGATDFSVEWQIALETADETSS